MQRPSCQVPAPERAPSLVSVYEPAALGDTGTGATFPYQLLAPIGNPRMNEATLSDVLTNGYKAGANNIEIYPPIRTADRMLLRRSLRSTRRSERREWKVISNQCDSSQFQRASGAGH
jgi:hypothetical protein